MSIKRLRAVKYRGAGHRKIAERVLGKPLPYGVIVHHHDGDGRNDSNDNLVICENREYHKLLHRLTEQFHQRKSHVFTVKLHADLACALVSKAECEGMSAAALVRMAVRHFLDPDAKCKPAKVRK